MWNHLGIVLVLSSYLFSCSAVHSESAVKVTDSPTSDDQIASIREFIESALEPVPALNPPISEREFMSSMHKFERHCRVDFNIELRNDLKTHSDFWVVAVDFRARYQDQASDDVSHLGLKSESGLLIPKSFDSFRDRSPESDIYRNVTRIQRSVNGLISTVMRRTSICVDTSD